MTSFRTLFGLPRFLFLQGGRWEAERSVGGGDVGASTSITAAAAVASVDAAVADEDVDAEEDPSSGFCL